MEGVRQTMKFIHFHPEPKGGVTIAYEILTHENGHTLKFAIAQVSNKDCYCKQTGRDVSLNNYIQGKTFSITVKGSGKKLMHRMEIYLNYLANSIYHLQANQEG